MEQENFRTIISDTVQRTLFICRPDEFKVKFAKLYEDDLKNHNDGSQPDFYIYFSLKDNCNCDSCDCENCDCEKCDCSDCGILVADPVVDITNTDKGKGKTNSTAESASS